MTKYMFLSAVCAFSLNAAEVPVYFGSGSNEGISYALLDSETGALSGLKIAVETSSPGSLTFSKKSDLLFAVGREKGVKEGFVASFTSHADGSLKLINSESSMGAGPCHITLDKGSNFLFVANYSSGSIASFQVDKDGVISKAVSVAQHEGSSVNERRQRGPHAHSVYASPDNKFVYSADLGIDKVMIYKLNATTGALVPSGSADVPAGSGPRHMAFSPSGDVLYVLNELTLTVSKFSRNATTGALTLELTAPVVKEKGDRMTCSEIQLSADGRFIYTATRDLENKQRDVISVLNVTDLSIIQEQPAGVWIPRNFGISPSGKWFLIAGQKANKVVVHKRDIETGKLSSTSQSVDTHQPMWILFP